MLPSAACVNASSYLHDPQQGCMLPEHAVMIQAAAVEVNVCEDALRWIHVGWYLFSQLKLGCSPLLVMCNLQVSAMHVLQLAVCC